MKVLATSCFRFCSPCAESLDVTQHGHSAWYSYRAEDPVFADKCCVDGCRRKAAWQTFLVTTIVLKEEPQT